MIVKPSLLSKFKVEFEYTEDIIDFKRLMARINLKRRVKAAK